MNKSQILSVLVIIGLLAGNIFFASKYYSQTPSGSQDATNASTQHKKIIDFTALFVDEVLRSDTEVDFDTRLKLETSVRELHDADILALWKKFTDSKNQSEVQENVKELLHLLVVKLQTS